MAPTISVCIPTYNSQLYIGQAIESVLEQTYQNYELIITDNGSADNTEKICQEFAQLDKRVKFYRFDFNVGNYGNLNRGIELSQGKYVKFLCSDDMLDPSCISKMLQAFEAHPQVTLVGCAQKQITASGELDRILTAYNRPQVIRGRTAAKDLLLKMSNDIGAPPSVMARKQDCGTGFNRSYLYCGDMDLWCRLLLKGDYCYIHEPLSILRLHDGTATAATFKTMLLLADMLKFREDYRQLMFEEGISSYVWDTRVDELIMNYVDYILLEQGLTINEVKAASQRLISMAGEDMVSTILEALSVLVFYAFKRTHELNIEARWLKGQVGNLEREMNLMTQTKVWKMSEPFRALRNKLTAVGRKK
ncbi:MAG: glycosyltransferase family 2 protein [Candidatus Melainabacteria bacterium]|nr:glycosyltransferase family 2 protein [Candidatus Melainabacteria bacterium]